MAVDVANPREHRQICVLVPLESVKPVICDVSSEQNWGVRLTDGERFLTNLLDREQAVRPVTISGIGLLFHRAQQYYWRIRCSASYFEEALDASSTCTVDWVSVVPLPPKTVPSRSRSMSDPVKAGADWLTGWALRDFCSKAPFIWLAFSICLLWSHILSYLILSK